MAWVNIDYEVFGSDELRRLGELMGWDEDLALVKLARMWMGSQKALRLEATARELAHWSRVPEVDAERLAAALSDPLAGWIKLRPAARADREARYLIIGNAKHVKRLKNLKVAGKKGGRVTREKWKGQNSAKNPALNAEPNARAQGVSPGLTTPGPTQSNSTQFNPNISLSSTPKSFLERLSTLPKKAREREREAFEALEKQYGDPDEIASVVEHVFARGTDLRGSPIGSLMGYLQTSYAAEREDFRELQKKQERAAECAAAAERRKQEEQAVEEAEVRESIERELAFLEAFPNQEDREFMVRKHATMFKDQSTSNVAALKFTINAWWQTRSRSAGGAA